MSLAHLQAAVILSSGFVLISENRFRVPHGTLKRFLVVTSRLSGFAMFILVFATESLYYFQGRSCGNRGIFPNRAKFVGHVLAVFQPVALLIITQVQLIQ